ncbi:MAG: PEP-CTERM-box response regulator transcription factor [Deltaproteobacteria bacterium]|nr:MAG: PEP-CTERM-box response regulator transcription factor [Deltaproteobacteria bacterium]
MNKKGKLLVVEDDPQIARQLKWALADEYDIHLAENPSAAMKVINSKKLDVVALDLGLPPKPEGSEVGMELLGHLMQKDPSVKVVVVTGNNDRESAIQAISQGAWDFYQKPIDIDEFKVILSRASSVSILEREYLALQKGQEAESRFEELIGKSPQIKDVFAKIRKVAKSNVSVMVVGESGTGKELIARAIHNQSPRRAKPFVVINCGAIPENLLEAELFGHEKGAYTGAHLQRKGKVEYANGGTLFLDEIGELPPLLQVKLLRFLEERVIERIGGRSSIDVDVRIIAATHKNLENALTAGGFREDLYYRLSVVTLEVPPLRERGNDILLLAHYFMQRSCQELKRRMSKFDPQAIRAMLEYEWRGNVRELVNRIKRAVVMGDGPTIGVGDLDLTCAHEGVTQPRTLKDFRETLERDFIYHSLAKTSWNIARTAEQIGVSRPTLYDLIKKYELKKQDITYPTDQIS